jgi:apoptosis-inducing factor 3
MERVLGLQMGDFVRALQKERGLVFHLQDTVKSIDGRRATLGLSIRFWNWILAAA